MLVLAALAVTLAGCSSPATPVATPTVTATPAPAQADVQIKDFAFTPQEVRVARGGSVTWTNQDSATHTISFNGVSSGVLDNGDSYSKPFGETGIYDYICGIHTYMNGRVVVE